MPVVENTSPVNLPEKKMICFKSKLPLYYKNTHVLENLSGHDADATPSCVFKTVLKPHHYTKFLEINNFSECLDFVQTLPN